MADKKISQLTALSAANLAPSTDVLAIVDTSATETKKIVAQDLINGVLNVASAVGIGTSSPAAKLDVVGTVQSNGAFSVNGTATGTASKVWFGSDGGGGGFINVPSSQALNIYQNNATLVAQFSSSGNLGLGVTPSAWASGNRFIDVNASASYGAFGNTDAMMLANAFWNGSNWIRKNDGNAFRFVIESVSTAPTINWQVAANSTAGSTISFTQAMTLDASGNLGVGTTSPGNFSGTVKLVVGSAATTTTAGAVTVYSGTATYGGLYFADGTVGDQLYRGAVEYNHSTDALLLYSAGAERARITAGGYFKASDTGSYAGATASYHELISSGTSPVHIINSNASGPNGIYQKFTNAAPDNNTQYFLYCEDSTNTARVILYSDGDGQNHDNSWGGISDERLKQDIVDANSQWDDIKNLRVRKYRFKSDVEEGKEHQQIGLIAQEVIDVSPGLVTGSEDTQYGVQYSVLYMKAVKALQEAMTRIEQLEAKVAALEAK
jgi:hypothetical protein